MSGRVVNLRHEPLGDAVYVGRANPRRGLAESAFANPFRIGEDGDRAEVVEKYRSWLLGHKELLDRLHELRGRTLACWCAPEPCHANVLMELVDADEVLDELKAAGVSVEVREGLLRLKPASNVSEALVARVRLHKPCVLELLADRPPLLELAEDCRQLVDDVAESLRLPPDVLVAETVEQARERQAAAIERLRLDRLAYIADARRAGVYRGLANHTGDNVG